MFSLTGDCVLSVCGCCSCTWWQKVSASTKETFQDLFHFSVPKDLFVRLIIILQITASVLLCHIYWIMSLCI